MTTVPARERLALLLWQEIALSGRSQADVARAVGITPKHMCQAVQGRAGLSLDLADQILRELGCELVMTATTRDHEGATR